MKEIALPEEGLPRERKKRALARARKAYNILTLVLSAVAVLCLIGLLVSVIVLEMRENPVYAVRVLYILTGVFAAGAAVFAFGAFGCAKLAFSAEKTERDFRERCCGQESFFVGEGTLVTFEEDGVRLHDEENAKKPVFVPYRDMTFHSVCTRKKPREKGAWSVVLSLPSHYVVKEGKEKDAPPRAAVQTDAKERLYRTLEAHGLELLGEAPPRGGKRENRKFTPRAKFLLPDAPRRKRALIGAAVAGMAAVAGVCVAVFWREMLTVGVIVAVFGAFFGGRSLISFFRAKGMLAFYEEGLYWQEGGRAVDERIFLKWEEIERVSMQEVRGVNYLKLRRAYGSYHLPDVAGAYEYLSKTHPEKVSP